MKKIHFSCLILFVLVIYSDKTNAENIEVKINQFITEFEYGLTAGNTLKISEMFDGKYKSIEKFIEDCMPVASLDWTSGTFYDIKKKKLANGRYESVCKIHNTRMIEEYINGVANGVEEKYYENGNLMSRRYFKNGLMHGLLESYKEDGTFSYSFCYVNGMIVKKNAKTCD